MYKMKLSTIAILLFFSFVVKAQEVKGLWAGTFEADDAFAALRLNFDESKINLNFAGDERAGAIKDLKMTSSEISFDAELKPNAKFTGKIENGKITGTFDVMRRDGSISGKGVWSARKVDSLDFKADASSAATTEKLELTKPQGAFSIGRKFFYWTDESRAETITDDANDKRKIFVQLWYPSNKVGKIPADYYPDFTEIYGADKKDDARNTTRTYAFTDAKLAKSKTKFPVILFSPGLGSSPFGYTAIIENLVSRGYVVAAINHPYDSGDFKFSDGQIVRFNSEKWDREISKDYTAEQRKQFFDERRLDWGKDISFVANQLQKLEKSFKDALDVQNLGLFGHSFGGQATSIACASDARFKACANLDGMAQGNVVLPNEKGEYLKQPFLFFTKAAEVTDTELKIMSLTRAEYRVRESQRLRTRWKPSFKSRLAELDSGAYVALYPGVKHSSFSDSILLYTKSDDPLFADRLTIAANINDYITAFFDKFLLKKSATLLDSANNARPPVIVEFLKK